VSYLIPATWREAKICALVDAVRAEPDVFERVRIVCEHLDEYGRLAGAELIAAREAELEHERRDRLIELLKDTDPARVEAVA